MDEVFGRRDTDSGTSVRGTVVWGLRLLGLAIVVLGLALWLLTSSGLVLLPGGLVVAGLAVMVVPGLLAGLVELLS
ncbi:MULTISPECIES: hypothetical protein [Halomicrobium]|uniref:Uncharacterized protein n=2 Tax=Halomicrobium mukohataei TaxID=57705 RepID=C7P0W7_HALMD|nr:MULTISPECIES: hypothetical protein [Halomicrobium]ACV48982.1 hypothetical protein Hmuk_2877 [Halomicrobium mukohataei DSM 12286]QCD64406.1 hypothetical protein E5139_01665 [Halomicrobium mukohataei]QFR19212.1 hypothetical protein GBQ70_01665 [Halomicrobium sp. ZPS1]